MLYITHPRYLSFAYGFSNTVCLMLFCVGRLHVFSTLASPFLQFHHPTSTRHPPLLNHGPCRHQLYVPLWGSEEFTIFDDTRACRREPRRSTRTGVSHPPHRWRNGVTSVPETWKEDTSGLRYVASANQCADDCSGPARECSVVQRSVGSPLLAVCLYFLPVPFRHPTPLDPHANPRMMMQTFQYYTEPFAALMH